ncbi:MAG: hypothetical protein SFW64_06685 [Alphaproteobacteria bacterium]|nr:hypothetical protein [Alphaproteobacteria bacterium]
MFPRWLSWMFLLALGYVIFSASEVGRTTTPPAAVTGSVVPPITKESYPALAEMTDIERWKRRLNPASLQHNPCAFDNAAAPTGLGLKVMVDATGQGAGATCGARIRVQLTIWSPSGGVAYAGELPLVLGARTLAAGLDVGLLGITKGEQRSLVIPPYALTRTKDAATPAAALKALPANRTAYVSVTRLE